MNNILPILLLGVFLLIIYNQSQKITEGFSGLIFPRSNTQCQKPCHQNRHIAESSLYTSDIPRSINTKEGKVQDSHFSHQSTPKSYTPPCLTEKPYGNSMASYQYWKKMPELMAKQYQNCDKYQCKTQTENGYTALPRLERTIQTQSGRVEQQETLACDVVNQEYYHNPTDFCKTNPQDYPCPNWWQKNPQQIKDISLDINECCETNQKVKPQVAQTKNNKGFCLETDPNCVINDGVGLLMIRRGHEDQALC